MVEFKVNGQCLKVFCYHGIKSTNFLFYSIFRTTHEVSSKLYFVEICHVSEKLWFFNHKRAEFWIPNFGFKRSLLSLLKLIISGVTPLKRGDETERNDLRPTSLGCKSISQRYKAINSDGIARMSTVNLKIVQLILSKCFHGKRPLWELKLVKKGKHNFIL